MMRQKQKPSAQKKPTLNYSNNNASLVVCYSSTSGFFLLIKVDDFLLLFKSFIPVYAFLNLT
jgi:hypothetical protein